MLHEYKNYSQNGEDGVLEWLIPRTKHKLIVEIGWHPKECQSRNLVKNHGWRSIPADARRGEWITAENVNWLFYEAVGVLSIDVDGNDYWLWKAIRPNPDIVCIEYNAHLGIEPWVLKYDPKYIWDHSDTHGASIGALCKLASERGYQCLGCESRGVNAFFIHRELGEGLPDLTPEQAFVPPSRGKKRHGVDYSKMVLV